MNILENHGDRSKWNATSGMKISNDDNSVRSYKRVMNLKRRVAALMSESMKQNIVNFTKDTEKPVKHSDFEWLVSQIPTLSAEKTNEVEKLIAVGTVSDIVNAFVTLKGALGAKPK